MKYISVSLFTRNILRFWLITHHASKLSNPVDAYHITLDLSTLLDEHAPIKTKTIRAKPVNACPFHALLNLPAGTLKDYTSELVHPTNSNSFAQPLTNIIQQSLMPRNALILLWSPLALPTLAQPVTLSTSSSIANLYVTASVSSLF